MDQLTYYQENSIRVLDEEEREQLFAMRGILLKHHQKWQPGF